MIVDISSNDSYSVNWFTFLRHGPLVDIALSPLKLFDDDGKTSPLAACIEALFAPIIRFGTLQSLDSTQLREIFDKTLLEILARHIRAVEGRAPTSARLALYSGLAKGKIESMHAEQFGLDSMLLTFSRQLSELLAAWHSRTEYASVYGMARPIDIFGIQPPSFEHLCRTYVPGHDVDEVLAALLEAHALERTGTKQVMATKNSLSTKWDENAHLERLALLGPAYLETLIHNYFARIGEGETLFEGTALTEGPISMDAFQAFIADSKIDSRVFLKEQDQLLNRQAPTPHGIEGGIGVYMFRLKQPNATALPAQDS